MGSYRAGAQFEIRFNPRATSDPQSRQQKAPGTRANRVPGAVRGMDRKPGKWNYAQVPTTTNTLLGVRVIDLGAAGGCLLPIAGTLKDILLVGVAAELLGTVGDVDDRGDVGDQHGD